jgi:thiol-disulfide isomerase/thioredoxin
MRLRLSTLIAALAVLAAGAVDAKSAPRVGDAAPAVIARTLDGEAFDLGAQRGRVVVVNLWATWCAPCRAEMPALDSFYGAWRGRGVEVIGLSADRPRDIGDVRRAMRQFSYPAALLAGAGANAIGAPAILPVTYVIDRAGRIRAIFGAGGAPLTLAALTAAVAPLAAASP